MVQSTSTQHPCMHLRSKTVNGAVFKRFVCLSVRRPSDVAETKPIPKVKRSENPSCDFRRCSRLGAAAHFLPIFKKPFCIEGGLLWAERAVIKEVKHAFKMSVPLLFHTNNTLQLLKGEVEAGKKQMGVKEGRQGGDSTKLPAAQKLSLPSAFH